MKKLFAAISLCLFAVLFSSCELLVLAGIIHSEKEEKKTKPYETIYVKAKETNDDLIKKGQANLKEYDESDTFEYKELVEENESVKLITYSSKNLNTTVTARFYIYNAYYYYENSNTVCEEIWLMETDYLSKKYAEERLQYYQKEFSEWFGKCKVILNNEDMVMTKAENEASFNFEQYFEHLSYGSMTQKINVYLIVEQTETDYEEEMEPFLFYFWDKSVNGKVMSGKIFFTDNLNDYENATIENLEDNEYISSFNAKYEFKDFSTYGEIK